MLPNFERISHASMMPQLQPTTAYSVVVASRMNWYPLPGTAFFLRYMYVDKERAIYIPRVEVEMRVCELGRANKARLGSRPRVIIRSAAFRAEDSPR